MSLLQDRFRGKSGGFIPFVVAGDPDLRTTAELLRAMSLLHPIAIELGIPFSDPTADGPVIQRGAQRALGSGTNLAKIFRMLKTVKGETSPIILFSYYNPILQFGLTKLAQEAAACGVAAVLAVDLPAEVAAPLQKKLRAKQIDLIFLVAPTTSKQRLQEIARLASGFIYAVARTGVTGTAKEAADESSALVRRIRRVTDLPVAVGFGITDGARARKVCGYADAAVVGSRLVAEVEACAGLDRDALIRRVVKCARQFA